jgi:hypothetical protein
MRHTSFYLSIGLVAVMTSTVIGTLVLLTRHEPAFYKRTGVPVGKQRHDISLHFVQRAAGLLNSIQAGGTPDSGNWNTQFTEEEVNSFLEEDFLPSLADKLLPEGVSDPRIAFEQDRLRLGFRYGSGLWSTIISIDFRVWLAQKEPNVVVLQLKGVHAGSLPISAQSLLENISGALRPYGIQAAWYRHQGNPTAVLKFQSDQLRPTWQLLQLDLKPGMLTIVGHSNEPMSPQG